jgi:hypothetical protein
VIGNAVKVMKIATGEEDDDAVAAKPAGRKGGQVYASTLSPERRKEIATLAAKSRWKA